MADVPATHHAHATATAIPATVVAAAAISIGAFACASTLLAYYATFAASLVCLARAVSPERVDEFLAHLDAHLRRTAQLARDAAASVWTDVEADLRRLRDAARGSPVVAPVYARAEERARVALAAVAGWADALKSWAAASWTEHKEAAHAAQFLLRLVAAVINLAATALFTAAYEEAKIRAPAVLRYLRGLIRDIRPPPPLPCKKTEEAALSSGFDCLDVIVPYLLCSMDLVFNSNAKGPMQIVVVTFVTSLGLTILFKELFYAPDDSDKTDTADDVVDEADTSRREAAADDGEAEAGQTADHRMRESWDYLWLQIIVAYGIDAFLLRIMVGPRLVALALLARFNLEVLKVCRRIQLAADDGEGAKEGSEGADKWRSAVMAVLVASGAKVLAIYLMLGFHLAAHSFASLCLVGASLVLQEASLSDLDVPEEDDSGEEGAGLADDVVGGAEESEEVSAEHSNRSTDEGIIGDAKEGSATEQHCDISEERAEEQLEEEEPDNSRSSSSSMMDDNGWDLVEVDPEMPIDGDHGADRKRSTVFPWKYVA